MESHCLNSHQHSFDLNVSSRFNTAVFVRANKDFTTTNIWQVAIKNGQCHGEPQSVTLGEKEFSYRDPVISADGKALYFSSDKPIKAGGISRNFNLWRAEWQNGQWQNIEPLNEINSAQNDTSPHIHGENLYFTSDRHGAPTIYQTKLHTSQVIKPFFKNHSVAKTSSGLSLSPDGNIALIWLSANKNKTDAEQVATRQLYVLTRQGHNWSSPLALKQDIQAFNQYTTAKFSPDGQYIYLADKVLQSTGSSDSPLEIIKVDSKSLIPNDLYDAFLASRPLDILADRKTLDSVSSFSYRFDVNRSSGEGSSEQVNIEFSPFTLTKQKDNSLVWTDGKIGFKSETNGEKIKLTDNEISALIATIRYNFIHLFKQQHTKIYFQQATAEELGQLYRVEGEHIRPFTMLLSKDNQKVLQLRYDDLAIGYETDYELVNGVLWPMTFSYVVDGQTVATGRFSNVSFLRKANR